jgi:hypothetical protein
MAFENYTPELWSDLLMTQREQESVFAKLTTTEYNGEIEAMGDRVHITGLGRPTVRTYTKEITLTAEYMNDNTVELVIDQANYFDVYLDDVDKKQSIKDPMSTIMQEGRRELVEVQDIYLGTLYSQSGNTVTETQVNSTNIIEVISAGITDLYENNIPSSEEINLVCTPAIVEKIMMADILFNTDNSETMSQGWIGRMKKFINAKVWMSNAVAETTLVDHCMMFTRRAIGLAEQIPAGSIERLRSDTKMADHVRALHLFGAKVIKPKELVRLDLTPVAEA